MQIDPSSLLVVCHCYAGDRHQVLDLLPYFTHHGSPLVVISPVDSQVHGIGGHITRCAGEVAYIGQKSWDRQHAQLKVLLEYPQKWFLLNDSDSFCITPKLPDYLFERTDTVYGNEVDDFRKPGESWQGLPPWPDDYHKGYPLIAIQPPYFLSRECLEKIVKASEGLIACPITPFIDFWWVPAIYAAGVRHERFRFCASCETKTQNGLAVMRECVVKRKASLVHSIKEGWVAKELVKLYNSTHGG